MVNSVDPEQVSTTERIYGLSLIWQETSRNFPFFDRLPRLDWDSSYRQYIPQVVSAEDLSAYYDLLARFAALLQDDHTAVLPPPALHFSFDII